MRCNGKRLKNQSRNFKEKNWNHCRCHNHLKWRRKQLKNKLIKGILFKSWDKNIKWILAIQNCWNAYQNKLRMKQIVQDHRSHPGKVWIKEAHHWHLNHYCHSRKNRLIKWIKALIEEGSFKACRHWISILHMEEGNQIY